MLYHLKQKRHLMNSSLKTYVELYKHQKKIEHSQLKMWSLKPLHFLISFTFVHYFTMAKTCACSVCSESCATGCIFCEVLFSSLSRSLSLLFNPSLKHAYIILTPLKPHFYIVKLGFTGVLNIFIISAKNIDCGYSLELVYFVCLNISGTMIKCLYYLSLSLSLIECARPFLLFFLSLSFLSLSFSHLPSLSHKCTSILKLPLKLLYFRYITCGIMVTSPYILSVCLSVSLSILAYQC